MSGFSGFNPGAPITSTIASGSGISLTTGTTANITSISIPAGNWRIWGVVGFNPAATTNIADRQGGASATTATMVEGQRFSERVAGNVPAATLEYPFECKIITLAATTTYFLVATANFTVSTCTGYGHINAIRAYV